VSKIIVYKNLYLNSLGDAYPTLSEVKFARQGSKTNPHISILKFIIDNEDISVEVIKKE
jgi:hypothetical protein